MFGRVLCEIAVCYGMKHYQFTKKMARLGADIDQWLGGK